MELRRRVAFLRNALPEGRGLPHAHWSRRHKGVVILLWAHAAFIPLFGVLLGHGVAYSLLQGGLIAALAAGAASERFSQSLRMVIATLGLVSSSAVLIHLSGGAIEMHFHFFVVVAIVALYQSWLPLGVAIAYVMVHHAVMGAIEPSSLFNHPAAVANPWKWAAIHGAFILGESVACLLAWKLNEDVLDRERTALQELKKANADLGEAQALSHIGSWEWDVVANKVWWSPEMYRILGVERDFVPSFEAFVSSIHPDDRSRVVEVIGATTDGREQLDLEFRVMRPDASVRVVHTLGDPTRDPSGSVIRILGTCQDITDRKLLEDEIEHRAFHDTLTGLANRSLFTDRVEHALALRARTGISVAVLFIDLDDFKTVNDTLGHAAGDVLLNEVANRVLRAVRPSDTVARLGGDEFGILLEATGTTGARRVAERVQQDLRVSIPVQSRDLFVNVSAGIAVAGNASTTDSLLRDADIAMYAAKRTGKNACQVFEPSMRNAVVDRLELKAELQRALDNEEFFIQYQPIVNLDSHEVTGVEALVRWKHPRRGIVPPNDFIPLAEETGAIVALGGWVLREATKSIRKVGDRLGLDLAVSVNMSPRQLQQPGFMEEVRRALTGANLEPRRLILEITETVLMADQETSADRLQQLRDLGVRIAIDDFGTGYSSLSYLRCLPLDILKIDRAFVSALEKGPEESALAKAVVKLASILNLQATAEGVENAAQLSELQAFGCGSGQGYLFAPPLDLFDLEAHLSAATTKIARTAHHPKGDAPTRV